MPPPFVPNEYIASRTARTLLWKRRDAPVEPFESMIDEVIVAVERHLEVPIQCELHVVVYGTNAEACAALDREVPPGMLLAPYQTSAASVVAMHGSAADPGGVDLARSRRHLAHEFVHIAAALSTGSAKRLGDGDRLMRVEPWVNEGFACVVSAVLCDRVDLLERELGRVDDPVGDLNAALDDRA